MQHNFIYRRRSVTIVMRRESQQWWWRQQLDGSVLGEGRYTGSAQHALREASQSACQRIDEALAQARALVTPQPDVMLPGSS